MKQALLLLTAGLILVGGVFVFADRAGITQDLSQIAVSFMGAEAEDPPVIVDANPDGTCDPGFSYISDGKCRLDEALDADENGGCPPDHYNAGHGLCLPDDSQDGDDDNNGDDSDGGGIDWFFPEGGFVPCGKRGPEGIAIQEPCNICHAAELGQNILNFLVTTVMPFLAILFSAIGGFLIMTAGGSENRYRDGRDQLVRVAIGVLIVLIAWAGINFVMKTFFDEQVTGSWYEFQCSVDQEPNVLDYTPTDWQFDTPEGNMPIPDGHVPSGTEAARLTAAQAKAYLEEKGIEVASSAQLEGIRLSTLNELVVLKAQCSCEIVVTGGTGSGHSSGTYSHSNGYKIDVRSHSEGQALTDFIMNSPNEFRKIGIRQYDNAQQYINLRTGHIYALETNPPHWDIAVAPR